MKRVAEILCVSLVKWSQSGILWSSVVWHGYSQDKCLMNILVELS